MKDGMATVERTPVTVYDSSAVASRAVAAEIADLIRAKAARGETAVLGLAYHSLAPQGQGVWFCLGGFLIGFMLLLLPWILGGGGMGDVKLLAALGAWLGPVMILIAFGGSAVIGLLLGGAVMFVNTLQNGLSSTRNKYLMVGASSHLMTDHESSLKQAKKRRILPFAVPIMLSTWCLLAWMLLQSLWQ